MSWIATKYAWKCSNPLVKGSVRLVLLAIALRVEKHKIKTTPTSLDALERLTFLDARQIRRCLDLLCAPEVGEVARVTRGKRAVYELPKLAGPLFVCDQPEKSDMLSGFPKRVNGQKPVILSDLSPDNLSDKKRSSCPDSACTGTDQDQVRTEDLCTTTTADAAAAVETFLDWFTTEYPKHRHGALYDVNPAVAESLVRELLQGRSIAQLQAMAIRMWRERRDKWVRSSDYGLHVLKHRAPQLENQLANERAAHQPRTDTPMCAKCKHAPVDRVGNYCHDCRIAEGLTA